MEKSPSSVTDGQSHLEWDDYCNSQHRSLNNAFPTDSGVAYLGHAENSLS